jgi:hypothetical protein
MGPFKSIDPQHQMLRGLYLMTKVTGIALAHSPRAIVAGNLVVGPGGRYPKFPDGFLITLGDWSQESIEAAWVEADGSVT